MAGEKELGKLIGTVESLTQAFSKMEKSQETNRQEFMDIFKDMRDNMQKIADGFAEHMQEDLIAHAKVESLELWRNGTENVQGAEAQIEALWDGNNRKEGALGLGKWVAGIAGGIIGAAADFLMHTHGGNKP